MEVEGRRQPGAPARELVFSVIVPTFARPSALTGCLAALAVLDFPRDEWEVIVVDDGSENPPDAIVQRFANDLQVQLVLTSHAGPAAARNAGAAVAKGRYLAFTDDDCRPTAGWLRALRSRLDLDPDVLVGGRTVNAVEQNPYSAASQCLIDHLFSYYNADPSDARLLTSNNLALAGGLFRSSEGFDERFPVAAAEDRELCDRLRRAVRSSCTQLTQSFTTTVP